MNAVGNPFYTMNEQFWKALAVQLEHFLKNRSSFKYVKVLKINRQMVDAIFNLGWIEVSLEISNWNWFIRHFIRAPYEVTLKITEKEIQELQDADSNFIWQNAFCRLVARKLLNL